MADFHSAFEDELRNLIARLPIDPDARVLDVACGDGFYSHLLAERVGPDGQVIGLDVNRPFLELAEQQGTPTDQITFVQGNLKDYSAEGEFDVVWCAQSLYSLPEPSTALAQMMCLLKPGGLLAILENDTLHQLLLPWPAALELAVRTCEFEVITRETRHAEKYYVGRHLSALLADAGLEEVGLSTQAIDRGTPLPFSLERFLRANLRRVKDRVLPLLQSDLAKELRSLVSPECPQYLLHQPHFTMTWLNRLAWGRKPSGAASFSRN